MSLSALRHEPHATRRLGASAGVDSKGPNDAVTSRDERASRQPVQLEPHWQVTIESATD